MKHLHNRPPVAQRASQRGAAALVVALVLLFGMTVIAFFANRGMLFEQRTSANQYRSTKAFEVAEAGMEWAVARMNNEGFAAAAPSCNGSTVTTTTLTERYLSRDATGFVWTGSARRLMACRIGSTGAVNCVCPERGTAPSFASSPAVDAEARFLVEFVAGPDPTSIRIISRGCTNAGASCELGTGTPDGFAVVTALYKIKPAFPSAPGAGLITGAAATTGGNLTVINKDPKSNGITINSGSIVDLGGSTSVVTLGGTPPRASVLDNDPALRDLTNADANGELFFRSFFNEGFTDFKNSPKTWIITADCSTTANAYAVGRCTSCPGNNAGTCGQKVSDAWRDHNVERFWADVDIEFSNNNYPGGVNSPPHGSPTRPLAIASTANIGFSGTATAYGMFFAATATANDNYDEIGNGNATIYGSLVSRSTFTGGNGDMRVVYEGSLFNPQNQPLMLVRVPGSWRDSLNEL